MRSTFAVLCRLKPDFDESGYTGPQKVILAALKRHGMSDGGEIALTFADDRTSTAKWADLGIDAQTFSDIGVDQFESSSCATRSPSPTTARRNP